MISFYILIKWDKKKSKEYIYDELDKFSITLIYILSFLGASYSMIMSPFFPDRVWSGPLILFLIAFLSFYNSAFTGLHIKYLRNMQLIFVASLSIISIAVYGRVLHELEKVEHQNSVRTAMLENCSKEGKKVIYLPTIRSKSKYTGQSKVLIKNKKDNIPDRSVLWLSCLIQNQHTGRNAILSIRIT